MRAATLEDIAAPSALFDAAKSAPGSTPHGTPARTGALQLRAKVLLPDGYVASGSERYPVLYLLHAMTMAYDHWAAPGRGDIAQLAAGFPGIIVMPEGGAVGFYSDWWDQGRRAGAKWESYYLRELIPMIERRYRIRAGRRWHAIAGVSMGGHGAMYLASQLPGYFGSASAFSAPLDSQSAEVGGVLALGPTMFGAGNDQDHLWGPVDGWYSTGHNPSRLVETLRQTRLFVSYATGSPCDGDRDGSEFDGVGPNGPAAFNPPIASPGYPPVLGEFERIAHDTTVKFVARAHAARIALREQAFPCGTHWWENFQRAFRLAREQNLFAPVPESPASYTYTTTAQAGQAWDLHYALAAAPQAALTLIRRDLTLVARGSGRLTITTAGGCAITAELPFERTLPAAPCQSLHVRVQLRDPSGARALVRASVRDDAGAPVAGALVRIGRQARTTGASGRARFRVSRPERARRLWARVTRNDYRSTRRAFTVPRAGGQGR